ncbi:YggN family protein [Thalassotalea litorea]|uniref:YggN family protein n=1 Tax=Thalassotalea litorea TaxID=2020715 RepID=UPI0037354CE4
MKKLMLASVIGSLCLLGTANAHEDKEHVTFNSDHCSINMNYGVIVENDTIRFLDDDNTIVQINNQKDLFVQGKQIDLSDDQQTLVTQYAAGVNQKIPKVVNIALDAVEIAFSALSHVATGLTGEDSDSTESLNQSFAKIKEKVSTRFRAEDGSVYLAEQDFDELDQFIEDELEGEIEDLVSNSVGDILIAVGQAMNDEEGDFEQKMEAFGERMERMGEEIEVAVEGQAEVLEAQAETLCADLHDLNELEDELTGNVDELADFDLIQVTE